LRRRHVGRVSALMVGAATSEARRLRRRSGGSRPPMSRTGQPRVPEAH
jgi:hypothetical protein